jgi:hypothetical protein
VQFLTGSAKNALLVANSALRFRATPEMMAQAGLKPRSAASASGATATSGATTANGPGAANGVTGRGAGASGGARGNSPNGAIRSTSGMLWYLDKTGKLAVARVKTGLTDGQTTEITPRDSTSVQAGMQVIVGANATTTTTTSGASSANPLQPQSGQRRGPGGF